MDQQGGSSSKYTGMNRLLHSQFLQELKDRRDDGSFREIVDDWKWIFSYSRRYKKIIFLYTLLGLAGATLSLVSAVVSKYMIDIVVGRKTQDLWLLALLMVSSMLFSLLFSSLVSRFAAKIRVYVHNDIQADIFDKIMDSDWMHLSAYAHGDLLNRFSDDVAAVSSNAVSWIPTLIIDLYSFLASFAVILHYDVTMAFIALISAPVLLLASRYIMRKMRIYRRRLREVSSDVMSYETEVFYHMDTIKSFGIMDRYGQGMREQQARYRDAALTSNAFDIKARIFTNLVGTLVALTAFGYCLARLWSGAITFGTMTLFLQQRSALSGHFNSLVKIFPNMLSSSVSASRIRELTELPRELHDPQTVREMQESGEHGFSIRATDLDFSYDDRSQVVRSGSLRADPGEIVGLIGASGEGKTTLMRLLLGLVFPEKGSVKLCPVCPAGDRDMADPSGSVDSGTDGPDDISSKGWNVNADVRRFISYVPQGNSILAGTVEENLRMVKADASEEEMESALKQACAWQFVCDLPQGLQTKLGERGHGLSEGQAQRVAIARALLRGAPILLLDEATSALDAETEKKVLENIMVSDPRRTVLVTTHRPAVLSMCSRVYRVADGKLEEITEWSLE